MFVTRDRAQGHPACDNYHPFLRDKGKRIKDETRNWSRRAHKTVNYKISGILTVWAGSVKENIRAVFVARDRVRASLGTLPGFENSRNVEMFGWPRDLIREFLKARMKAEL